MLQDERADLTQHQAPSPCSLETLIDFSGKDSQRDQQQWHILRTICEDPGQGLQEEPRISARWSHPSHGTFSSEERTHECKNITLVNPTSSTVLPAICMMVEDPYFESPKNSPTSEETAMDSAEQWLDLPSLCLNDENLEQNSSSSGT